jgi:PIN domain nuclease of toxin-antitoxin system
VQRELHGIESLPIDEASVARLSELEPHHRYPFDRILVCQAIEHDLQIVTVDRVFSNYPASLLPGV